MKRQNENEGTRLKAGYLIVDQSFSSAVGLSIQYQPNDSCISAILAVLKIITCYRFLEWFAIF